MDTAVLVFLIVLSLLAALQVVLILMVGSVVVQVLEAMSKLPDELRSRRKERQGDRPWWTYL